MKALTIQQPFANLIVRGLKHFEIRSWKADYVGILLIHAAAGDQLVHSLYPKGHPYTTLPTTPKRAIIGAAYLRYYTTADHRALPDEEKRISKPGDYAWRLINPIEFEEPIPSPGQRPLWQPDSTILDKAATVIKRQQLQACNTKQTLENQTLRCSYCLSKTERPVQGWRFDLFCSESCKIKNEDEITPPPRTRYTAETDRKWARGTGWEPQHKEFNVP